MVTQLALNQSFFQVRVLTGQPILSGNGLVWSRTLGLGPRDFGGSNPPYPTIYGGLVQMARISDLQSEGRGFDSLILHHLFGWESWFNPTVC